MNTLSAPQKAFLKRALLASLLLAPIVVLTAFLHEHAWIIIFLLGAGLAWFGNKSIRDSAAVASWPKVSARVISSSIGESYEGDRITRYFPLVKFEYTLPSGNHTTEAFSPAAGDFGSYERKEIENMLETYSPEAIMEAYVCPQNPDIAYLRREVSPRQRSHFLALVAGGLLLLAISVFLGIWQYW